MYCTACGSQNPDVGSYCFNCGKPLMSQGDGLTGAAVAPVVEVTQPTPPLSAAAQPADSEGEHLRSEHPELVGVNGWLGWFCIVLIIISPIVMVINVCFEFSAYSLVDLSFAALSVYTGVCLWKVSPRALKLTKILLIIQFCIGALLLVVQLVVESSNATHRDPSAARTLVGSVMWFWYFKKSKRVRATFGSNI